MSNVLIFTSLTTTKSSEPIQNVKRIKAKRWKQSKRNKVVKNDFDIITHKKSVNST